MPNFNSALAVSFGRAPTGWAIRYNAFVRYEQKHCSSVDCKKKELIGNYKNQGGEWEEKKHTLEVKEYDFVANASGKAFLLLCSL
ncbi:hypothetical protein EZS27_043276 [termite gut metagenome]|uniref:Uncharacterized protein n=1 Tax=termite gut metagenome TaxID=433724 RepID=A0A5J4P981_9ZZZZ